MIKINEAQTLMGTQAEGPLQEETTRGYLYDRLVFRRVLFHALVGVVYHPPLQSVQNVYQNL